MSALLGLRRSRLVITLEGPEYVSSLLWSIGFVFFGSFDYILKTNSALLFEAQYYLTAKNKRSRPCDYHPNEHKPPNRTPQQQIFQKTVQR